MTGLIAITVLALLLGMRHATDADHVVAVTTIVARERSLGSALAIGGAWGVGHTLTVLAVGGAVVVTGWVVPARLELSLELGVAVMLMVLGVSNLDFLRSRRPRDPLFVAESPGPQGPGRVLRRPLLIGVVHGLAGSAAVALIVLTTIPSPAWSIVYLLAFGFGSVLGMMLVTASMSLPFLLPVSRTEPAAGRLRTLAGVASFAFGVFLAYDVVFVEGLFAAAVS